MRAIQAGVDPDHVEIVEIDEIPLAYLTEPVARISVKAVGPLRTTLKEIRLMRSRNSQ